APRSTARPALDGQGPALGELAEADPADRDPRSRPRRAAGLALGGQAAQAPRSASRPGPARRPGTRSTARDRLDGQGPALGELAEADPADRDPLDGQEPARRPGDRLDGRPGPLDGQ